MAHSPLRSSARAKPRVLLVEDEKRVREHLARSFSDEFHVETVGDGEQALIAVLRARPDVIVTDIVMPTLDGVELVRLLRDTPSTSTIPILLTSGRAPEEVRIAGFEVGADSYLAKPYSERELRARFRAMLRSGHRRDELAQQNALERSTAERAALLESITDGFFAIDDQWRFTYVNGRARIFRQADCRPLGKRTLVKGASQGWIRFSARTSTTFEDFLESNARWIEIHVFPGPKGLAVNFRDITDRRTAEQTMREAERRKDEFVATLAHELRNPLAPIRSGIHALRMRLGASKDHGPVLAMMDRQMTHLVRLLDDLLDVSRISRGMLDLRKEVVALANVIDAAIEASHDLIQSREHRLSLQLGDEDLFVHGDRTRLAQVLSNLLANAAKYTDPGGQITISLVRENDDAVISVKDTGVGIPPHAIEQVFEMFSQVRSAQNLQGSGLGIGLSVVRTLVQMHGGTVIAASDGLGKGSMFTVRLPIISAPTSQVELAKPAARGRTEATRQIRVLVVDDNKDAAQTLAMLLELDQHIVRVAFRGETAISAVQTFKPDLVFMDLGMPEMDGFEATHRIRELPVVTHPAIVAVTGWGQETDRARTRAAGMDEHLVKPVEPESLRAVIARMRLRPDLSSHQAT